MRIWVRWAKTPLNNKMAYLFLSITILSSLIVGLVSNQLSTNMITKSSINESSNAAKAVAVTVDSYFTTADQTFLSIYSNTYVMEALKKNNLSQKKYNQTQTKYIEEAVSLARQLNDSVQYINIYGKNDFSYTDFYYHAPENTSFEDCNEYYSSYGLDEKKKTALWVPNQTTLVANTNKRLITLVRYIRDIYSLEILGIMTMGLTETSLSRQYQSVNNIVYIVEKNGSIVSHYQKPLLGTNLSYPELLTALNSNDDNGTLSFNNESGTKLFTTYSVVPSTGWYIVSIADHHTTFLSIYNLSLYIALILFLTIIISGTVLVKVSKILTASINRLFSTMKQAMSGDLSVRFTTTSNDEVNKIGRYLNEMLKEINESILYKEESERLARLSELRLLQSQINPHLLYNTLDSVHYHLETGKYERATDILQAMSAFFKLSLSQGDFLIPIEREISLIQNYLDIQRICRSKDITLNISGDSSLMLVKIPKMTLQPIVENSIIHGFEGDVAYGAITIDLQSISQIIIITVTDNGTGMTKDQVNNLNACIHTPRSGFNQKHYGLWNINQRLKEVFGNGSGIVLQSEFGEYTKAVITLSFKNLLGNRVEEV